MELTNGHRPNLFRWATSELSQDALICWLLEWAKPESAGEDPKMHRTGRELLSALLAKHDVTLPTILSVDVQRQVKNMDVVAVINKNLLLLIEDKTYAGSHGDQLARYKKTIAEMYPDCRLLPTFVKTGSQSRFEHEVDNGYRLFLRSDFLKVLRSARSDGVESDILSDFLASLEALDEDIRSFEAKAVDDWSWNPWVGFYEALQAELDGFEWNYVPNPAGGFLGAWWYFRSFKNADVYLQIEQGKLCFKIGVEDREQQTELRDQWHERIMRVARDLNMKEVERPERFGKGNWMTAAFIRRDTWMIQHEGILDFAQTLFQLRRAEELLSAATVSIT